MKNKKGFTLIELLAVLVVLAILALISIPITIRIINNARENSYKRSIASYGKAFELAIANYALNNPNNEYQALNLYNVEDMYSGNRVVCDLENSTLENGKLNLVGCIVVKEVTGSYNINNNIAKNSYEYLDGLVTKEIVYTEYNIGDTFTLNGDSYHIIKDSSKKDDYVVALKDEPLSKDDIIKYDPYRNNDGSHSIESMNGYGSVYYYRNKNCGYTNGSFSDTDCTTDYDKSILKQTIDAWEHDKFSNNELKEINNYTSRTISIDDLLNLGYIINGTSSEKTNNVPDWIYNSKYWYWTMTGYPNSTFSVWCIMTDGSLYDRNIYYWYGYNNTGAVRPVINVYKSAIEG